jgi:hypothetical protein
MLEKIKLFNEVMKDTLFRSVTQLDLVYFMNCVQE